MDIKVKIPDVDEEMNLHDLDDEILIKELEERDYKVISTEIDESYTT
jgi:hypothetical protein